ncbi:MAG: hypothetical protein A2X18_02920 [Bacteroidetes bacterium GWF2_40_14]|nr:MAG: hypothetical protein A2X18_02920 [Bacteroidetes bacterium GWF2_40_14]
MRNIYLTILAVIITSGLYAQNNLKIMPEKPHPGDKVKFSYTPPQEFAGEKAPLQCTIYKMGNYDDFYGVMSPLGKPVEMEIKKSGNEYVGELTTEESVYGLVFRFTWGDYKTKNNNNNGYFVPFYTAENKPCPTAYAKMGKHLSDSFFNKWQPKNLSLAREYYLKEMENYPEKSSAIAVDIYRTYNPKIDSAEIKKLAVKQLERIFKDKPTTDADYLACNTFFYAMGLKRTASYFTEYATQNNVEGYFRTSNLYDRTINETNLAKKKLLLDSSIVSFKNMDFYIRYNTAMAGGFLSSLIDNYLVTAYNTRDKKTFDEALNYIQNEINCGFEKYFPYMELSNAEMAIKNYNAALNYSNTLYSICRQKFNLLKNNPASFSPGDKSEAYLTKQEMKFNLLREMIQLAKTQAVIYSQSGDCKNALSKLNECRNYATLPEAQDMGYTEKSMELDLMSTIAVVVPKCMPLDEAVKSIGKIISNGQYSEDIVEILKELYVKKNGNDNGFNAFMTEFKKTDNTEITKKLEEMKVNETAPDFSLVNMDGKTVKLSDLKGKTVILDFWATWCGPCRASFPAMQQLVDHYKSNPDIVFLFIDTFEGNTGGTTVDKMKPGAKKIMEEKKFSFQVLFDSGDTVAAKYKVKSIPAKFVIDKNGIIRYKALGSGIYSHLIDEMMAMIKEVE